MEEETSDWNSKLEEAVQCIGQSAQGYKLMHIWQAQRARKKHQCLMGTGIFIGPIASVITSIGLAFGLTDNPTISVTSILLGFISGILIATVRFGKFDEVSNANKSAAARYTSIESNVRRQLGLYRKDRISPTSYMDWLETKYEELFMSAPLLPSGSYKKFLIYAKNEGISVPEQYGNTISINNNNMDNESRKIVRSEKIEVTIEDEKKEETSIKRSEIMEKIPQLNQCSDKMLAYEMRRMMGIR